MSTLQPWHPFSYWFYSFIDTCGITLSWHLLCWHLCLHFSYKSLSCLGSTRPWELSHPLWSSTTSLFPVWLLPSFCAFISNYLWTLASGHYLKTQYILKTNLLFLENLLAHFFQWESGFSLSGLFGRTSLLPQSHKSRLLSHVSSFLFPSIPALGHGQTAKASSFWLSGLSSPTGCSQRLRGIYKSPWTSRVICRSRSLGDFCFLGDLELVT